MRVWCALCVAEPPNFNESLSFSFFCNHSTCCEFTAEHYYDFLIYTFPWNLSKCRFCVGRVFGDATLCLHVPSFWSLFTVEALDWDILYHAYDYASLDYAQDNTSIFVPKISIFYHFSCLQFIFFRILSFWELVPFATFNNFNFMFMTFNRLFISLEKSTDSI